MWRREARKPSASARVGDPPYYASAVVSHEQGAVLGHRDPDWPAPYAAVVDHEARHEIIVLAGRHPVLHAHANDLVSRPRAPVPRTVESGKSIAPVFRREGRDSRRGLIERHL